MNYTKINDSIMVTGYSKIPRGIAGSDVYSVIGLGLVVDIKTGIIIEADCNLVIDLAKKYTKELLVGENITDVSHLEFLFKTKYHGSARKAIIVAIKVCYDRYLKAIENKKTIEELKETTA